MNHREAWAEEREAPDALTWQQMLDGTLPKKTPTPDEQPEEKPAPPPERPRSNAPAVILRRRPPSE
jgi:hypothetical protein